MGDCGGSFSKKQFPKPIGVCTLRFSWHFPLSCCSGSPRQQDRFCSDVEGIYMISLLKSFVPGYPISEGCQRNVKGCDRMAHSDRRIQWDRLVQLRSLRVGILHKSKDNTSARHDKVTRHWFDSERDWDEEIWESGVGSFSTVPHEKTRG